jgi:predicted ester cyclase
MRELDVVSTSTKRITIDQVDDAFHVFISVPHTSWSFELTIGEADEVATALAKLVEERLCEVRLTGVHQS